MNAERRDLHVMWVSRSDGPPYQPNTLMSSEKRGRRPALLDAFGRDLRYAFAISRGGLLLKYDLLEQREVGRIRGGISTRNIAVSGSGKYIVQANMLPKNLVIIDAFSMKPVRIIEPGATVGAVYDLRKRGEFVVSLKDKPQLIIMNDETLWAAFSGSATALLNRRY